MCGNFWKSSHYQQWILDGQELELHRRRDLQMVTLEELQKTHIFLANYIKVLGETLKMRQQVIATATMYFKRFYSKHSLSDVDPMLMCPACVYLASKVEECGVISSVKMMNALRTVAKKEYAYILSDMPYGMGPILECEFFLLEVLDCCLIVYHPYRCLTQYISDIGQESTLLATAWKIVNDSYRSDLCLLQPPYLIALAAIHMAAVIQKKDIRPWFAELNVDMNKILEITKTMLVLYDLWKKFEEKKEMPDIWAKIPKPKLTKSKDQTPATSQPDNSDSNKQMTT